jgi:hypothetical protein
LPESALFEGYQLAGAVSKWGALRTGQESAKGVALCFQVRGQTLREGGDSFPDCGAFLRPGLAEAGQTAKWDEALADSQFRSN